MLRVLSLQRDSSIQSQNLCETESLPSIEWRRRRRWWKTHYKIWVVKVKIESLMILGATKQSQKKNSYWMQKLYVTVQKERDTLFCEVGIWKRRKREWRRKHWRIDSWKDETWREPQKLKPSQTFSLLFYFPQHCSIFLNPKIKIDSAIHIHSLFFFLFTFS